jgi:hypothetical protein
MEGDLSHGVHDLRGIVSLALALALQLVLGSGVSFPLRTWQSSLAARRDLSVRDQNERRRGLAL